MFLDQSILDKQQCQFQILIDHFNRLISMESTQQLIEISINKENLQYYSHMRQLIEQEQISYWIGNPSVQIINGSIQLYPLFYDPEQPEQIKAETQCCQTLDSYLKTLQKFASKHNKKHKRKELILCGIPNSKPPTEVLQILKPFVKQIQQIRVIKTVDIKHYAVLLLMTSEKASQFLHQQIFAQEYNSLQIERIILRQIKQITLCFSELLKTEGLANQMKLLRQVKSKGQKMKPQYIFMSTHRKLIQLEESPIKIVTSLKRKMSEGSVQQTTSPVRKTSQMSLNKHSPKTTNKKLGNSPSKPKVICVICLQQLTSQLVSILCGHYFDWECLQKWQENTCPLCRYHQQPPIINFCELCNQCEGLWVCLICGVRLCCGIQNNILGDDSHIYSHFKQTGHALSMELETKFLFDARIPAFLHQVFYQQIKHNAISSNDQQMIQVNSKQRRQKPKQGKQGTKNKIRLQIEEYQKNVTQQMHHQRQYYQSTVAKIARIQSEKIAEKKVLIGQIKAQLDQMQKAEQQLQRSKATLTDQQTNLQKQYSVIKNIQKMLLERVEQKKIKKQNWNRIKQQQLDALQEQLKARKQQLKDFRKNLQVRGRMKIKLKGEVVQGQVLLGNHNQKKFKKKK